jgi:hypothetical protein
MVRRFACTTSKSALCPEIISVQMQLPTLPGGRHMKATKFTTFLSACLLCILPVAVSAQPYVVSTDGSEVTDQHTGLIWKRCSEGMNWDGTTCAGTAGTFTHEAALTQATSQATSTGVTWRLPNVKELSSITDKTVVNPAIDSAAFPVTPTSWFWSSTPYAGSSDQAWGIHLYLGVFGPGVRANNGGNVRLVRGGQ